MKFFFLIISATILSIAFTSCKKEITEQPVNTAMPVKNTIAYIYKSDSTDAGDFKKLLQVNGCAVTLVDRTLMAAFDFSKFNMIVVGNNNDGTSPATQWTSADSSAIKKSGKPVLMIGIGGMQLAKKLDNTVNMATCGSSSATSINIPDPTSTVYKSPKNIDLIPGNLLDLYTIPVPALSFYSATAPANVVLIGKKIDVPGYYPVTFEANKYCLFGFYDSMDKMTTAGKDFLVNLVYYTGKLSL